MIFVFLSLAFGDMPPQRPNDYKFNTQMFQSDLTTADAPNIRVLGNITLCGSATSVPTLISDNVVCELDFGSCFGCYNIQDFTVVWSKTLSDMGFPAPYYGRARLVYKDGLLIGATASRGNLLLPGVPGVGAWVFAVNATDGSLVWKTQISTHIYAIVTQDITLDGDHIYVGLSSGEAAAYYVAPAICCSAVGSTTKLRTGDGGIIWSSPNIPAELVGAGKYSGASTWGGAPVRVGNFLYQSSGQLYTVPADVAACITSNPTNWSCIDDRVMFDGVIKRNANTGEIVGYFRAKPNDVWNIACILTFLPGCQTPSAAYDHDITNIMYSQATRQLIATSKSGYTWYLDTDLQVINSAIIAVGSTAGGMTWHAALNDNVNPEELGVYIGNNNGGKRNVTVGSTVINWGFWARQDGLGNTKWITPCPEQDGAYGSISLTNDLVLASTRFKGLLVIMNANTGAILNTIKTKGSMTASPLVTKNKLVWPTGPGTMLAGGLVNQNQMLVLGL